MKNEVIATAGFSHHKRHYFFDFKRAVNGADYISITCSKEVEGGYERATLQFFERDIDQLVSALSDVLVDAAYAVRKRDQLASVPADPAVNGIKSWEPEYRPREKLVEQGRDAVSDAELLAMLIGTGGIAGVTAVDLGYEILKSVDGDLRRLAELGVEQLMQFKGMGLAKSVSVVAAMELGVRIGMAMRGQPVLLRALRG